jgi:predicted unusual protein kinase regulating ubiquinone biosynthesis (AarF/ABC1/UbiB family)
MSIYHLDFYYPAATEQSPCRQDYARKYLKTHITQDVCLYHADIHMGNMMRFKGQLRLIDFGVSRLFPTAAMEYVKDLKSSQDVNK